MPQGSWSAKDERQYEAVKKSCLKKRGRSANWICTKIAASTVNKGKATRGETKTIGRHCPRGTVPLKTSKTHCYNRRTHKRVRRTS